MTSEERLGRFFGELQKVRTQEPQQALRWTGEQLAAASDRLSAATADSVSTRTGTEKSEGSGRRELAAELLVIAYAHVEELKTSGMPDEALLTLAMAALTVLHARVSPEEFPSLWLQTLQALCHTATVWSMSGAEPIAAHTVLSGIYGLFLAEAHSYMPRFGASESMRRFYNQLRHATAADPEATAATRLFRGMPILPTMAIDILTDVAVRMHPDH